MRSGAAAKRSLLGPAKAKASAGVGMVLALAAVSAFAPSAFAKADLTGVQLPPGFQIELWADKVPLAREMAVGDKGTVFVGTMRMGAGTDKVYYIRTVNG